MNLSNKQKMLLHTAATAAGAGEAQRRLVQQNVGGCYSAADRTWTRQGFIAVMAFWETHAGGTLPGFTREYWQGEDSRSNPTDALIYRVRREAAGLGWTDANTEAFLKGKHMSSGACERLADAPAYWLHRLLEAIKVMKRRAAV